MVHIPYVEPPAEFWVEYYQDLMKNPHPEQPQLGYGDLPGFIGYTPYQRGSGLGNIFAGLFRRLLPILKPVAKAVGKQALSTGASIAADVVQGRDLKESAIEHGKEAAGSLLNQASSALAYKPQQQGSGLGKRPHDTVDDNGIIVVRPPPTKKRQSKSKQLSRAVGLKDPLAGDNRRFSVKRSEFANAWPNV